MSAVLPSRPPAAVPEEADRILVRAVGIAGAAVIASWLFVAIAGISTRDQAHVSGVWMGLAAHVNNGVVYPPLYDGTHYGGTRYMPLFFLAHAALARLTAEYVISGHLLVSLCTCVLLALMLHGMRRSGCGIDAAVGLTSIVLVTGIGLLVTTTIRGDVLPAALQLAAIQVSSSATAGRRRLFIAALLCALALFAKVSALWAVLAIGTYLLMNRSWRRFAWFSGAYVIALVMMCLILHVASDGRFLTNMRALTFTGNDPQRMGLAAVGTTLGFLREAASPVWALMGLALGGLLIAVRARQLGICHLAFLFAGLLTLIVLSDPGTGGNQLIDIVVLSLVVIGRVWGSIRTQPAAAAGLPIVAAAAVLWILVSAFALDLRPEVKRAWRVAAGTAAPFGVEGLRARLTTDSVLLSEDPAVPVMLGQLPVVLDPWTLLRFGRRDPDQLQPLIARIESQEFDAVLLLHHHMDPPTEWWYELQHFGRPVVEAIAQAYEHVERVDGLHLYAPKRQRHLDER